jgi:hypothetical protein
MEPMAQEAGAVQQAEHQMNKQVEDLPEHPLCLENL